MHGGDATAVAALVLTAIATRRRASGRAYAAIARAATASLVPGAAAIVREVSAHGANPRRHRPGPTVVLLLVGAVVNTIGGIGALPRDPRLQRAQFVGAAFLVGGDLVDLPYLALVGALHRRRRRP